jgi:RimJ/RimL family protein N-acetyltransferase
MEQDIKAIVDGSAQDRSFVCARVTIETSRLILDELRPGDAAALFAYRSDPEVARYQGWQPTDESEAADFIAAQASVKFADAGSWCQRAIRLRNDGQLIGDLGMHFPDEVDGPVELGISLAPLFQRNGYAREAMMGVLNLVFGALGHRRVVGSVDPRNLASINLLRALGWRQEAHHRESLYWRGEWVDDMIFALLASEWSSIAVSVSE